MAKAAAKTTKGQNKVTICGVEFDRPVITDPNHIAMIPKKNSEYIFRDEIAFDFCMDILENESPMLVGMPSTGKTSLPRQVAAAIGMPVYQIDCEEDTKLEEFVGSWKYIKGEMVWVDGPLTTAMRYGYIFLFNEYDYASSGVLGGLNGVLEPISKTTPDRRLVLAANHGEVVTAHPNFRLVATCNSLGNMQKHRKMFPNARPQNHATLGRFKFYSIPFMTAAQETQLMMNEFDLDDSVREYAAKFVRLANDCRLAFDKEEFKFLFQTRHLMYMFKHIRRHKERHMAANVGGVDRVIAAAKAVIFPLCQDDEQQAITGYIKSIFA